MLHDATHEPTQRPPPILSEPQFLSIEIAPGTDGSLWVSSTGRAALLNNIMHEDGSTEPRVPAIRDLPFFGPVGFMSSSCTTRFTRTRLSQKLLTVSGLSGATTARPATLDLPILNSIHFTSVHSQGGLP